MGQKYYLAGSGATAIATTLSVTALTTPDGVAITMTDVGSIGYAVLEPGNSNVEIISFTGITGNQLTGVTRGLNFRAPYTTSAGLGKAHAGSTIMILTNPPQLYDQFANKSNDETITGDWTVPAPATSTSVVNKAYADSLAISGAADSSLTSKGIVEMATAAEIDADDDSGTTTAPTAVGPGQLVLSKYGTRLPSSTQKDALAGGGTFGTPSTTNKYITQDYNSSASGIPVIRVLTANTAIGSLTSQFDITNPAGTTFRYTWDGTGTDPVISLATFPVGSIVDMQAQNFNAANKGMFVVTGAGTNYIEVTNAAGVVESNKTIGEGYIVKGAIWTKPTGLKYIMLEVQGGGGGGGYSSSAQDNSSAAGGGGGYSKKLFATADLSATENYVVGIFGVGQPSSGNSQNTGGRSIFKTVIAQGGVGGISGGGAGGTSAGGDINLPGGKGLDGVNDSTSGDLAGMGGSSFLGNGGGLSDGVNYGAGGSGADSGSYAGGPGVIIITEYFS